MATYKTRYISKRLDLEGRTWSEPRTLIGFRLHAYFASKHIGRGGKSAGDYQNHEIGTNFYGPKKKRKEATDSHIKRVRDGKVGEQWVLIGETGKFTTRKVKVKVKTPITDTSGNFRIDRIYSEVFAKWSGLQNWGICVCKKILGTWEWSQHSYCNAIDIHGSAAQMYAISRWLVDNADRLAVHTVIYNRQVWSREEPYWHYYSGDNPHTDHVHTDCDPQGTGYPPAC